MIAGDQRLGAGRELIESTWLHASGEIGPRLNAERERTDPRTDDRGVMRAASVEPGVPFPGERRLEATRRCPDRFRRVISRSPRQNRIWIRRDHEEVELCRSRNGSSPHAKISTKPHKGAKMEDTLTFFHQLSTLVSSGTPLLQALKIATSQCESIKLREVLEQIVAKVSAGSSFHSAAAAFPQVFEFQWIEAIRTGEVTGKMAQVLIELNKQIRDSRETKRKVKGALMYPVILISVAVIAVTLMLWLVVPIFAKMFKDMDAKLPAITQFVVDASNYIVQYGIYGVIAIVVGDLRLQAVPQDRDRTPVRRRPLMVVPTVGQLVVEMAMYRFASNLSLLLKSGVPMMETMYTVKGIFQNSPIYRDALERVAARVAAGKPLYAALQETGLFLPMLISMVQVGEESGQLPAVMEQIAPFYKEKMEGMILKVTKMVEPMTIMFMGIVDCGADAGDLHADVRHGGQREMRPRRATSSPAARSGAGRVPRSTRFRAGDPRMTKRDIETTGHGGGRHGRGAAPSALRPHREAGDSLVEMIITILVLGVLLSMGIPQFAQSLEQSRANVAGANLRAIWSAQRLYWLENRTYAPDLTTLLTANLIDPSLTTATAPYTYAVSDSSSSSFTATATRAGSSDVVGQLHHHRRTGRSPAPSSRVRASPSCRGSNETDEIDSWSVHLRPCRWPRTVQEIAGRPRRGSSLLEVQVAFAVLGIGLAGLCPFVVMQLRQVRQLEQRLQGQVINSRVGEAMWTGLGRMLPGPDLLFVPVAEPAGRRSSPASAPDPDSRSRPIPAIRARCRIPFIRSPPSYPVTIVELDASPGSQNVTAYVNVSGP